MSESYLSLSALERPIVFVDLETTGGSVTEHRITEIGVVEVGPQHVTQWSSLVNPQQPIPPFIQRLTGIDAAMVRGAPTFAQIAPALFERLDGKLFVAHNARFDRGFLRAEFQRQGVTFNPDVLCTVRLSRALFPRETRHGLDALIERHALVPAARHRALADADLLWQFWRRLHDVVPVEQLRERIERTICYYRLAGDLTEDYLDMAPAGCGVYALFGEADVPLYVGRSVRVRQRLKALLMGERRSSKEIRIAQQVRRIEWRETGGELGALLAEARWIETLAPQHNRKARASRVVAADAPWPFDGAIAFEERDMPAPPGVFHVVDRWRYLGAAPSLDAAVALAAAAEDGPFEAATYRLLQTHVARGLRVLPLNVAVPML